MLFVLYSSPKMYKNDRVFLIDVAVGDSDNICYVMFCCWIFSLFSLMERCLMSIQVWYKYYTYVYYLLLLYFMVWYGGVLLCDTNYTRWGACRAMVGSYRYMYVHQGICKKMMASIEEEEENVVEYICNTPHLPTHTTYTYTPLGEPFPRNQVCDS